MKIASEIPILAESLWAESLGPPPDFPALWGDAQADVAVVGGGITGLSAALHLAERGVRVIVLEAEQPGWGASGRNGGQVIPGLKDDPDSVEAQFGHGAAERLVRMSGAAPDLVFDLIARYRIDCEAERAGWLQPAHDARALAVLERRAAQWQARDAPVEVLGRDETQRLIGSPSYIAASLDRRGGAVQPLGYTLGLARAAQDLGAAVHGHSRVQGVRRQGGRLLVETARGCVQAEHVVMAPNGYGDGLRDRLRRSVVPVVSVQVATAPLSDAQCSDIFPERHVASDMRRLLIYFRLTRARNLVIGGRGAYGREAVASQMARLRERAARLFPQLGGVDWRYHWGGNVAMTADHYPHLHELEPGVTAALGYNGRGVAMATAMGRVLADRITRSEGSDDFPVGPLKPLPLYSLRKPVVSALVAWSALRDRFAD